ncbi:sigma-70 family RNA polymerase sigma factor [Lentisphaera marina]|uniref:sigma-70 family RNA polymerase sigma factor n=1 Tax=Lentisphaera marina TaxID=1111041 RepID=UPI002365793A|nr:sigma-70 family RNA polymerase sigma factor [Lentisphaera marina]MDD7986375.1 sigma-70 family RNA polymerase sigma factor [Lentisphaera marina]
MKDNTEFIRQFAPAQHHLHMYIRSLVPNFSDADDLLQEVAATAWTKFESFDPQKAEFKSWLFGIARNKALHSKRRFLRTQNLLNEVQMINAEQFFLNDSSINSDERQDALSECINNLSDEQKKLLLGRYRDKKKSYELADLFKRSAEQVRIQLFRLRKVLKVCVVEKISI